MSFSSKLTVLLFFFNSDNCIVTPVLTYAIAEKKKIAALSFKFCIYLPDSSANIVFNLMTFFVFFRKYNKVMFI